MVITVRLLESPSDDHIGQAIAVLVRAFEGDIFLDAMVGGNRDMRAPLFGAMVRAGALEGSIYIANDGCSPDKIFSVAVWFGPGKQMFLSEAQREQGWNAFFASLPAATKNWWKNVFIARQESELNRLLGSKYLNGWFANVIGTDPVHQRRGYASAIIRTVFERARTEKQAVSLSTQSQRNVAWYQRLGFRLLGQIDLPAETGAWPDIFLTWEASPDEGSNP